MKNSISYCASNKKQLIRVQARARRLCRMFGMGPLEQAKLISVLFETAFDTLQEHGGVEVRFRLGDEVLQVECHSGNGRELRHTNGAALHSFAVELPPQPERLPSEDIFWTLQQLDGMDDPSVFDEIRQQNNDLLRAILEVEKLSAELLRRLGNPHAA